MEEELKSDELINKDEESENWDEEYCSGDCSSCAYHNEEFIDEDEE